jgi:hypothetical protein
MKPMAKSDELQKPEAERDEPVIEFEVSNSRTLRVADFAEPRNRAEMYGIDSSWIRLPEKLADVMDECQPLAWAVYEVYVDAREALEAELQVLTREGGGKVNKLAGLRTHLQAMPEEPEDGATAWLLSLTKKELEDRVVPALEKWLEGKPDWALEDDYLPDSGTAQGAALAYFRDMDFKDLQTLGVSIVEGEHPGSTYYAAELRADIDEANRAAEIAGLPVRFVAAKG